MYSAMNYPTTEIIALLKQFWWEGYVNLYHTTWKSLEYNPLFDETSFEESDDLSCSVTLIGDHKKSVFRIDGFSLQKLENALWELKKIHHLGQYDEDIQIPEITDSGKKDFSTDEIHQITSLDLKHEFEKVKNYSFDEKISLEGISFSTSKTLQIYINSLGSVKTQSDNSYSFAIEIFWQNWDKRDTHYEYKTLKTFQKIDDTFLKELERGLLDKIENVESGFVPWKYDITLERDVVIDFLDIILWNLGAESMREGMSMFSKYQVWEQVFGENFTLKNTLSLAGYTGNLLFDKEWVTAKDTILFENGVLKNKFYDYKNALKDWLEYLGNSSLANLELLWPTSSEYLDGSTILFTNLMAFHTVDQITWKFALLWEWYLLENGKKTKYLKDISLSGNIIDLFSSIKVLWDDYKIGGNYRIPSVSFRNQSVI